MPTCRLRNTLIDLLKPALVVELGVHKGDSLLSMATALENFGLDGRVVGIDTWQGDEHAGQYDGSKNTGRPFKASKTFREAGHICSNPHSVRR